ncbi:hypothetical protein F0562_017561 [Nyssa sinensis]|uniref:Uncharacterized protein n=1 Tax=Nyssa sinensis TaxID=561372 RepID=A0A5J4ZI88_9ASTE|nr:hypothetical protein F0562_017561 [Nyssa sinensis]
MEEDALSSSSSMEVVEEQKENEMEIVNLEDKVEAPKIGMTFGNYDELYDYYIIYAKKLGFAVCRRSLTKGNDGELKYITLVCSRSGYSQHTSKNIFKPYPIPKMNCQAKIRAISFDDGSWQVNSLSLDHNHRLSPGKARFYRCNRVIRPYVKRKLEMNDKAGIRMNKSYNACVVEVGGHKNMTFLEKDCRNYIEKVRRLRLGQGDATAVQDYFLKMQANNANFFYAMDLDEKARLKNLFWADERSRAAYEEFGDVVTFDTTYVTNKYDMTFAPFVGVNHHGHSILLRCGLISNKDTDIFTWLFQTWLTCMSGRAPSGIIIEQDKAMKKTIEKVFPNKRHRWCLWHIMKKILEKLKGYKEYESIKFILQKAVYDTLSPNEFKCSWNSMIEKYKFHGNEWLLGIYTERHRWVPAFVKDNFWAGMSTTQRSESMHAFFDGYVNVKTTLKQFVEQYENALKDKDFEKFKSMGIGHIEGPTAYNVADIIGTQDSIVVNPSLQGHRDANMPNYTPQIMLGVDVATNLNLMQGNLNLHGYSRTPPTNLSVDYPFRDVTKRRAMGLSNEVNMPVNILLVSFPGHAHSQALMPLMTNPRQLQGL